MNQLPRTVLILFAAATSALSQSSPDFLTIDNGLSQNYIFNILQDSRGFLWFGTKDGLNRYDGYSVRVYRNDPEDSSSLSANTVTAIYEDERGGLWIGTNGGGVNTFDRTSGQFRQIHLPGFSSSPKNANHILALSGGTGGTVWIGTYNGAYRFDPATKTFQHFMAEPSNENSLAGNEVNDVLDEHDTTWFATGLGVSFIEKKSGTVFRITDAPETESKNRTTTFLLRDSRKRLLAGKRKGLFQITSSGYTPVITADDSNRLYWSMNIRERADGGFWMTTANALVSISSDLRKMTDKERLTDQRFTRGLIIDRSGVVWSGTSGLGALISKPRHQQFGRHEGNFLGDLYAKEIRTINSYFRGRNIPYEIDLSFRGANFFSAQEGVNNDVWFLTQHGLFHIDRKSQSMKMYRTNPKDALLDDPWPVNGLYRSPNGKLWVSTVGGVNLFDTVSGTFSHIRLYPDSTRSHGMLNKSSYDDITSMLEDSRGILWCGTPDMGMIRYDPHDRSIRYFFHDARRPGTLSNNHILTIREDPYKRDSLLWVGTDGGGLNRFDTRTETFSSLTTENGLPNNVVYGILQDSKNNLWMSTNYGLMKFNPASGDMMKYDAEDGLQSNEFNRNEYYESKNGLFYFGGIYGYNAFRPDDIVDNPVIPSVAITDFRLFNAPVSSTSNSPLRKSITETDSVTLEYSQNMFSIQFTALDFNAPKKNRYRYMLEGFDHQWIPADMSRMATYTNIDPGTYLFRVKGSNNDGIWNEQGKTLVVTILPPFWMTWWFRGILLFIGISIGPAIYSIRINQLKREQHRQQEVSKLLIENQESERKRIAQEMHDVLGQELLVIKNRALMGLKTSAEESKETKQLQQISESASSVLKTLREISHNLRPPELDRLGLTETLRAIVTNVTESSSFSVTGIIESIDGLIEKENEINIVRIIQEALSNVVKYSDANAVAVSVEREGTHIVVRVKDDGKGFRKDAVVLGIGLTGISERVRILHGTFGIHSEPGKGTDLIIHIPINGIEQQQT